MPESSENLWPLFHERAKYVRRGFLEPLTHNCGMEYTYTIGKNDDPALRCWSCVVTVEPGLALIKQVEAEVADVRERRV